MKKVFAVVGNPIKHTKSPLIYELFGQNTGIVYPYGTLLVKISSFKKKILKFFNQTFCGLNITVPFKGKAFSLCNFFTKRSLFSKSVNVIKKLYNGKLFGDNTDGIGLVSDLKRIKFLKFNIKILIIGAGGASRGILYNLLQYSNNITVTNRTFQKAKLLCNYYNKIKVLSYDELDNKKFQLIINATSSELYNTRPNIPDTIINSTVFCYDLFYKKYDTLFLSWCKSLGAKFCSDGLGMLVFQAAHSFFLWHNVFPNCDFVIDFLRKIY